MRLGETLGHTMPQRVSHRPPVRRFARGVFRSGVERGELGGRLFGPVRDHPQMLVYAVSKAAMVSMVMNLAKQLAEHNVTVNNLAPGVATAIAP